jgi:hypothetical protein
LEWFGINSNLHILLTLAPKKTPKKVTKSKGKQSQEVEMEYETVTARLKSYLPNGRLT